jgi:hypothetical protein
MENGGPKAESPGTITASESNIIGERGPGTITATSLDIHIST